MESTLEDERVKTLDDICTLLGLQRRERAQKIIEMLDEEDGRSLISGEIGFEIPNDLYNNVLLLSRRLLHGIRRDIAFEDVELFDVLFTVAEKKRLLSMISEDYNSEENLLKTLDGRKAHFMNFILSNKEAFRCFITCQVYKDCWKEARTRLESICGSDPFIRYLDRDKDIFSLMKGTRIIDFEKMACYGSVSMTKKEYPTGTKITYEEGVETVMISGEKVCVDFDENPSDDARAFFGSEFRFNYIQSTTKECILKGDENVLVCAPTGSGKTMIGALSIFRAIGKCRSAMIAYVVPMKALVTEICGTLRALFFKAWAKSVRSQFRCLFFIFCNKTSKYSCVNTREAGYFDKEYGTIIGVIDY